MVTFTSFTSFFAKGLHLLALVFMRCEDVCNLCDDDVVSKLLVNTAEVVKPLEDSAVKQSDVSTCKKLMFVPETFEDLTVAGVEFDVHFATGTAATHSAGVGVVHCATSLTFVMSSRHST